MNCWQATKGDCRGLLKELQGLTFMTEVSISLCDSVVLPIQTLLNSQKLQRCLKHLKVEQCSDMNFLHLLFPYLEEVELSCCFKLKDVILHPEKEAIHFTFPRDKYFNHLYRVTIHYCPNLIRLTCLIYAPNLKLLYISRCNSLEEVIQVKESRVSEIASNLSLFSRLRILSLLSLRTEAKEYMWTEFAISFLKVDAYEWMSEFKKIAF